MNRPNGNKEGEGGVPRGYMACYEGTPESVSPMLHECFSDPKVDYVVKQSDFDTKVLGLSVAKIVFPWQRERSDEESIAKRVMDELLESGNEYATTRIPLEESKLINALKNVGFEQTEEYVVLINSLDNLMKSQNECRLNPSVKIRVGTADDVDELKTIAPEFTASRFFKDGRWFKKGAGVDMHERWIENSIVNELDDHVIVAELDGMLVGFLACKMEKDMEKYLNIRVGHVPLMGVMGEHQGKGIGKALLASSLDYFTVQKAECVQIETHDHNEKAVQAYERFGFERAWSEATLRIVM